MSIPGTDAELVRESRAGHARSFGLLVERHQRLVRAVALSASGDPATAEELAQEAFVTAWMRLHELQKADHFSAWVCGIARNLARHARRHQARHAPAASEPAERLAGLPMNAPSPLDTAIERQEQAILAEALHRIPESYREPLVLFYGEERSIADVAGHLGLSCDAVKQRLSRGRRYLEQGVHELLRGALARPVGVSAAVLATIAALPRAHALAGAGVLGGFASSVKVASGSVLSLAITLVACTWIWRADNTDAPRVSAPVAPYVTAAPAAPAAPAIVPGPAPEAAPEVVAAEPEMQPARQPARARRRARVAVAAPATPAADRSTALVIEHGPSGVSDAHATTQPPGQPSGQPSGRVVVLQARPSLSLHDALSMAGTRAPETASERSPGWRLPIDPPDMTARILELDI